MPFPIHRPRRLRGSVLLRAMVRETRLSPENFVYPLFVCPGEGIKHEISSMPGNYHWSVDRVVEECREVAALGVPSVILFGLPESKDEVGSGAYAADGIVQRAIRAIKADVKHLLVMTDVCLCEYTSHGHCGVISGEEVDNDPSLDLLARTALSHVQRGIVVH